MVRGYASRCHNVCMAVGQMWLISYLVPSPQRKSAVETAFGLIAETGRVQHVSPVAPGEYSYGSYSSVG